MKPWTVFALVSVGLVADFIWAWQVLPSRVVIHWNLYGQPDGWASKTVHLAGMAFVILFSTLLPMAITLALPRVGAEQINLPNKNYWLAPERRADTLRFLSEQMVWLPVGLMAFWGGVLHLTTLANLSPDKTLPATFWLLILVASVAPFVWIYRFVRPFYNKPE